MEVSRARSEVDDFHWFENRGSTQESQAGIHLCRWPDGQPHAAEKNRIQKMRIETIAILQ